MKDSIRCLLHNVNDIFVAVLRTVYFFFQINKSKHLSILSVLFTKYLGQLPPPHKKPQHIQYTSTWSYFFFTKYLCWDQSVTEPTIKGRNTKIQSNANHSTLFRCWRGIKYSMSVNNRITYYSLLHAMGLSLKYPPPLRGRCYLRVFLTSIDWQFLSTIGALGRIDLESPSPLLFFQYKSKAFDVGCETFKNIVGVKKFNNTR